MKKGTPHSFAEKKSTMGEHDRKKYRTDIVQNNAPRRSRVRAVMMIESMNGRSNEVLTFTFLKIT